LILTKAALLKVHITNLQIDAKGTKSFTLSFQQNLSKCPEHFGEGFFFSEDNRSCKTFEDACEVIGIHPATVMVRNVPTEMDAASIQGLCKACHHCQALNEGWKP